MSLRAQRGNLVANACPICIAKSLRVLIREILKKTVMTYKIYFGDGARGPR